MKTIKHRISHFDVRIEVVVFSDVWRSQVIILEQNVLVMNKSQADKKVYAFHAIFRVDVNDVNPLQNPTGSSPLDYFLDPQSMPRLFKTINRWLIQTLPLLIHYSGQVGYAHTKVIT